MQIIPSIFVDSEQDFLTQTNSVSSFVSMVQIDIADGTFVPAVTWADPEVVEEKLEIDCELHLMVTNPLEVARAWENVLQVKRVLVHYESTDDLGTVLAALHSYGWDVSIVLNPETPLDVVAPFAEEIDGIMCMGVRPGAQGQEFIPEVLEKLRTAKELYPHLFVSLDGGVNDGTLEAIAKTQIDAVCPGSRIFSNDEEPEKNVAELRRELNRLTNVA